MKAHEQDSESQDEIAPGRRELLKALAVGGSWVMARALLPAVWSAPVVASMVLPEHAQASCRNVVDVLPPMDSVLATGQPIQLSHTAGRTHAVIRIQVTTPPALLSARTQFQVYELSQAFKGQQYVCVVALITPSADATFSGTHTIEVTRPVGYYSYQLRWSGGYTAWNFIEAVEPEETP